NHFARFVGNGGGSQVVLFCVSKFHVPDRSGSLLYLASHPLVTFRAQTNGPFDLFTFPDAAVPRRDSLTKKVGEDVGRSTSVGAMNNEDIGPRKRNAGIERGYSCIAPRGDASGENVGDRFGGKIDRRAQTR